MAEAQPSQDDPAAAAATAAAAGGLPPSQPAETLLTSPSTMRRRGRAGRSGYGGEQASLDHFSIDELLKRASFDDPNKLPDGQGPDAAAALAVAAAEFKLPNFQQVMQDAQVSSIDLLRDVELNVKIELGRSRMLVEDVLKLARGRWSSSTSSPATRSTCS